MMIGERLQEIRKDNGDTQQDLANKLHASLYAVRCWEQGKSDPSHDTLAAICRLYEVSAGKERLGLAEDPYVMEPIKEDYLASGADEHTAAAYLSEAITTRPVLSCPEHADSPIQLSCALRESVDVIYIQTLDPGKG